MMHETHLVEPSIESLHATAGSPGHARVNLVFVLDGLRPDAIDPVDTPCIFTRSDVVSLLEVTCKAQLDIALRPTGERWAVVNDDAGIAALVARLQALQPILIVLEATGGYQRAVVAALAAAMRRSASDSSSSGCRPRSGPA